MNLFSNISQALVSNPAKSWQLQTKTCISRFACSSYVKSASAAGAEEIITVIQQPSSGAAACCGAWRAWQGTTKIMVIHCTWTKLQISWYCLASGSSYVRTRKWGWLCVSLPHCNLIHSACQLKHQHTVTASTHLQATQKALWRWASGKAPGEETSSCSCRPAHRLSGFIWSLSFRVKQYREFGSRTERLSRPF